MSHPPGVHNTTPPPPESYSTRSNSTAHSPFSRIPRSPLQQLWLSKSGDFQALMLGSIPIFTHSLTSLAAVVAFEEPRLLTTARDDPHFVIPRVPSSAPPGYAELDPSCEKEWDSKRCFQLNTQRCFQLNTKQRHVQLVTG